jgi:hypothetical protein
MDVSGASYYIQENNENKGSRMGHTKKNNFFFNTITVGLGLIGQG